MKYCEECHNAYPDESELCPVHGSRLLMVLTLQEEATLPVGSLINGQYRVECPMGQGGMGTVYKVIHISLNRPCAIKVLNPEMANKLEWIKRFMREAKATSLLKHPNIVTVHDFGQSEEGFLYIVMELLEGETLGAIMRQHGSLPPERMIPIAMQICEGLFEAHQKGLVHRDLKPDNIFLTKVGNREDFVKVLDFGIAGITDERADLQDDSRLTSTGAVIGTPTYIAPEQARGQVIDARTDIYSLGIIIYEALCGINPFRADNPLDTLLRQLHDRPPPLDHPGMACRISDDLQRVVLRCLEKDQDIRYQDVLALEEDLRKVLAKPASRARRPLSILLAVGACLLLAATFALALVWHPPAPPPKPVALAPTIQLPLVDTRQTDASRPHDAPARAEDVREPKRFTMLISSPLAFEVLKGKKSLGYTPLTVELPPASEGTVVLTLRKGDITHKVELDHASPDPFVIGLEEPQAKGKSPRYRGRRHRASPKDTPSPEGSSPEEDPQEPSWKFNELKNL